MELTRAIEYFASWGHHNYSTRTLELYVGHLRKFTAFIGDKDVELVNLFDDVIAYARHLERTGHRDNTVNLSMTSIRQLWRMLANLERQLNIRLPFLGAAIPVKKLVVAKSHRPISDEEFARLMHAITESNAQPLIRMRDLAVFALLYDTGLRISELTALNVSNLDLSRRSAEVVTRKRVDHFKRREVYWTLETHIAVLGYLVSRRTSESATHAYRVHRKQSRRTEASTPVAAIKLGA